MKRSLTSGRIWRDCLIAGAFVVGARIIGFVFGPEARLITLGVLAGLFILSVVFLMFATWYKNHLERTLEELQSETRAAKKRNRRKLL